MREKLKLRDMERTACLYALVRFMPYVESGEFVNVGVLLWAQRSRYLGYKLLQDESRRITQFFEHLETNVFLETMRVQANEFARVKRFIGAFRFLKKSDSQSRLMAIYATEAYPY